MVATKKPGSRTTHGMRDSREYSSWLAMRARCDRPTSDQYQYYGARGITIDPSWQKFENFFADMGPRPRSMTLDRKDNNGPYCKENCQWVEHKAQCRNRRSNVMITVGNETNCITYFAEKFGIKPSVLMKRIRRGVEADKLFSTEPISLEDRIGAVLNKETVLEMRALYAKNDITVNEIARRFKINKETVRDAIMGKTWKSL